MTEVGPVNGELIEGIELGFEGIFGCPRVGGRAFENVHPMVDGWAGVVAEHVCFWRWLIVIRVGSEDDVPFVVYVVKFWRPAGCPLASAR